MFLSVLETVLAFRLALALKCHKGLRFHVDLDGVKISNNFRQFKSCSSPESKGAVFIPIDRSSTFNYFYFVI